MFVSAECSWQCHTFSDFERVLPIKDSWGVKKFNLSIDPSSRRAVSILT